MLFKQSLILALMVSVSGCSFFYDGKPFAGKYDPPTEYKFKSVTHWGIVANDVSDRTLNALQPRDLSTPQDGAINQQKPLKLFDRPIYISISSTNKFGQVFASQLKSSFLSKGVQVSTSPKGALVLNFKVDVVTHSPSENRQYVPGTATALSASVLVIGETLKYHSNLYPLLGIPVVYDAYEVFKDINNRPNSEIVVTTTAVEGGNYLIHMTDTYYIDTSDSDLYEGAYPSIIPSGATKNSHPKTFGVSGS